MISYQYLTPSFELMSSYNRDSSKTWSDFPSLSEQSKSLGIDEDEYIDKIIDWSGLSFSADRQKVSDCLEKLPLIEKQHFNQTNQATLSSSNNSSRFILVDQGHPRPKLWHREIASHLGDCYVSGFDEVICSVSLSPSSHSYEKNHKASWLEDKLFGSSSIKLYNEGTDFEKEIRRKLINLPKFQSVSYGFLANKSARAVGGAMRRNPFLVIVPCHRVMGHNFSLTGYAGGRSKGLARKIAAILWDRLQSLR